MSTRSPHLAILINIPLKYNIIRIDGFAPPPESGGSRGEVGGKYSFFFIRKNRYLVTLARVSPRRNNRSRAQTSIFAIENLMSSTRARRQEARKCRPEASGNEDRKSMKSFNSYYFFQYFCSPAPVHEGMNNTKTIHFPIDFFSISALLH